MFNNLNVTLKKIIVVFLIITLTYANLVLIGSNIVNGLISYAANEEESEPTQNTEETLTEGEDENVEEEEIEVLNIENKDIHKTTISAEGQVEFDENIILDLTNITENSKVTIEDIEKQFYDNNETLNEEIALTYKTTTMNKTSLLNLLGEDGKIVIKDSLTDKVLVEITKNVISSQKLDAKVEQKFTTEVENEEIEELRSNVTVKEETVEIEYVLEVVNIKYELINVKVEQPTTESEVNTKNEEIENEEEKIEFVIENKKNISNINNKENLDYLKESLEYVINDDTENVKTIESIIKFKDTITKANLSVDNNEWIAGQANTVKYTIQLDTTTEKSELFVNPMFLLEMPSSVESINTAKSEFVVNNDNGAFTSKKVFVTTVMNRKFIVITLEGEQTKDSIVNGDTTIELKVELNVAQNVSRETETTRLYYQNSTVTTYESGKSFDTAEVTVSMIMESEPKDEIVEARNEVTLSVISSTQSIIKPEEEFKYDIYVTNNTDVEHVNLQINSILPEGISVVSVIEVIDLLKGEKNDIEYTFDNETRKLDIGIDKLEATIYDDTEVEGEPKKIISFGQRIFQVTVKADGLPEETYSKQIKSIFTLLKEEVIAKSQEVVNTISDAILKIELDEIPENINELEEFTLGIKITNNGLINSTGNIIKINVPEELYLSRYKTTMYSEDGQEIGKGQGTISGDFENEGFIIGANKTYYFQVSGDINELDETKQITITGSINGEEFSWETNLINLDENPKDDPTDDPEKDPADDPEKDPTDDPEKEPTDDPEKDPADNPEKAPTDDSEKEVFDLSLNQYLCKATVTNSKGTTTYEYKDTNFAKVEIHSKQMNGSKVTLEYKIVVKNEGDIPGYARKIVNYIPKELTFNAEQNSDWYMGDDGNLYSVALIEKLLKPGETAELKLILEKQMTNENTGTVTSLVEIYEASNDEKVEDVNSIPGDRAEGQNDISKVDVMIVTSTGTIILYTTLAIAVITIIGIGFYRVKKVTLNKKGGC